MQLRLCKAAAPLGGCAACKRMAFLVQCGTIRQLPLTGATFFSKATGKQQERLQYMQKLAAQTNCKIKTTCQNLVSSSLNRDCVERFMDDVPC